MGNKFVTIDSNGIVQEPYDEDNGNVPVGAVPITESEFISMIGTPFNFFKIENGALVTGSLEQARASATLSRREFFLGLEAMGLYDTIMALLDNPAVLKTVKIELQTATQFDRNWPTLISMAEQLSITPAQIDALFGIGE